MDYTEDLNDEEGVGTFTLLLKQKKDLTDKVELKLRLKKKAQEKLFSKSKFRLTAAPAQKTLALL